MKVEDKKEIVNTELKRIGIPLDHEHASYFRDGFEFSQKLALTMPVVSRSIGSDTKEILLRLTQDQKDKHYDACSLCRYSHNEPNSYQCVKCSENNDLDQYYG